MNDENCSESQPASTPPERMERFVKLWTENERQLRSYILALAPNLADAEQINQATNLRLWRQFHEYDPAVGEFAAWARSIAYFEVLTFRKKAGRERLVFNSELVNALADRTTARPQRLAGRQAALIDCLEKLPERSREIIRLYYYSGLKLRVVAERLGRSLASTEKAIVRIRRILYDCVDDTLQREDCR
jgi:RNA polymerase sigma-70 factor, ECF subfamily